VSPPRWRKREGISKRQTRQPGRWGVAFIRESRARAAAGRSAGRGCRAAVEGRHHPDIELEQRTRLTQWCGRAPSLKPRISGRRSSVVFRSPVSVDLERTASSHRSLMVFRIFACRLRAGEFRVRHLCRSTASANPARANRPSIEGRAAWPVRRRELASALHALGQQSDGPNVVLNVILFVLPFFYANCVEFTCYRRRYRVRGR